MTAAALRQLLTTAERQETEAILDSVCHAVGIGVRQVQSKERSAEVAKRRAVVAWVLCEKMGWTREQTATHLHRTTRQIIRLVRSER